MSRKPLPRYSAHCLEYPPTIAVGRMAGLSNPYVQLRIGAGLLEEQGIWRSTAM